VGNQPKKKKKKEVDDEVKSKTRIYAMDKEEDLKCLANFIHSLMNLNAVFN
jgi:hypothetical protein